MVASGLTAILAIVLYFCGLLSTSVSAFSLPNQWSRLSQQFLGPPNRSDLDKSPDMGWDIRYHLGGNSPWIPKTRGIVNDGIEPPEGCRVEQVHMVWYATHESGHGKYVSDFVPSSSQISRHAERYPTLPAGIRRSSMSHRGINIATALLSDT